MEFLNDVLVTNVTAGIVLGYVITLLRKRLNVPVVAVRWIVTAIAGVYLAYLSLSGNPDMPLMLALANVGAVLFGNEFQHWLDVKTTELKMKIAKG